MLVLREPDLEVILQASENAVDLLRIKADAPVGSRGRSFWAKRQPRKSGTLASGGPPGKQVPSPDSPATAMGRVSCRAPGGRRPGAANPPRPPTILARYLVFCASREAWHDCRRARTLPVRCCSAAWRKKSSGVTGLGRVTVYNRYRDAKGTRGDRGGARTGDDSCFSGCTFGYRHSSPAGA
jgi:hypothetical protein